MGCCKFLVQLGMRPWCGGASRPAQAHARSKLENLRRVYLSEREPRQQRNGRHAASWGAFMPRQFYRKFLRGLSNNENDVAKDTSCRHFAGPRSEAGPSLLYFRDCKKRPKMTRLKIFHIAAPSGIGSCHDPGECREIEEEASSEMEGSNMCF